MAIRRLDQPALPRPRPTTKKMSKMVEAAAAPGLACGSRLCKEPAKSTLRSPSPRFAQAAGEKAADLAAVCCCFPCCMVSFFYVVAVKLPAGLLLRAVQRRRRKGRGKKAAGVGPASKVGPFSCDSEDLSLQHGALLARPNHHSPKSASPSPEFVLLEKEMLESFHDLGFWRSLSQREREEEHKTKAETPFSLPLRSQIGAKI